MDRGATLVADRACDADPIRDAAAKRKVWAGVSPRIIRKGSFRFSPWVHRQRNLVERFFNRIKRFRGLAIRYDRRQDNRFAGLELARIRIAIAGT